MDMEPQAWPLVINIKEKKGSTYLTWCSNLSLIIPLCQYSSFVLVILFFVDIPQLKLAKNKTFNVSLGCILLSLWEVVLILLYCVEFKKKY